MTVIGTLPRAVRPVTGSLAVTFTVRVAGDRNVFANVFGLGPTWTTSVVPSPSASHSKCSRGGRLPSELTVAVNVIGAFTVKGPSVAVTFTNNSGAVTVTVVVAFAVCVPFAAVTLTVFAPSVVVLKVCDTKFVGGVVIAGTEPSPKSHV